MGRRTTARLVGVLGGLTWVAYGVADALDASAGVVDALRWAGLALVLLALVGIGAGLVSGAAWLRVLVAVCFPVLAWAVLELLREEAPDRWVLGAAGAALALVCAVRLLRDRDRGARPTGTRRTPRTTGTHAR